MDKTKLALIGCGGMGNHHAPILAKMKDVEIVGVCDIIEEKAKKLGEKIGAEWYIDYHDLLTEVDAVWVCTEPFNRKDIVITSAKAGKHIFTEKPICNNLEDADEMLKAAEAAGVVYMLGYCLRFWNPYKLMHDTFVSGELGELVNCWTRRYMPADMSNKWYGVQEKSGGVILDFGSHDIDWLRWIGGDVKTVMGGAVSVRPNMHAHEHGQSLLLFENGGMGASDISWSSWLTESSVGVIGTKGSMIVDGEGNIRKKIGNNKEIILEEKSALDINPEGTLGKKGDTGNIELVDVPGESIQEHFFRCIRENLVPITHAAEGRKTLATVKAIHESIALQKAVEVGERGLK